MSKRTRIKTKDKMKRLAKKTVTFGELVEAAFKISKGKPDLAVALIGFAVKTRSVVFVHKQTQLAY